MPGDTRKLKDFFHYYDFYKHPDGEECLAKTYYYTKYSAVAGAIFSIYEMVLVSNPTTIHGVLARFGRFTFPLAGMGFVFGSSLCLLGQVRKKNDLANHIMAGLAAGTVWGLKHGSIAKGHTMGLYLAFAAGYFRYFNVNGIPMFQMRNPDTDTTDSKLDWSIKFYDDPGRPNEA